MGKLRGVWANGVDSHGNTPPLGATINRLSKSQPPSKNPAFPQFWTDGVPNIEGEKFLARVKFTIPKFVLDKFIK